MLMDPIESTSTQMFFQMLHCFLDHKDRYHVINGKLIFAHEFCKACVKRDLSNIIYGERKSLVGINTNFCS